MILGCNYKYGKGEILISSGIISTQNDTLKAINSLIKLIDSDNMIEADTILNMKNQLLFKQMEKMVVEIHGSPFSPRHITKRGKTVEIYRTKYKGVAIQSNDYKTFIEKIADAYGILDNNKSYNSLTVDDVFKLALDEKARTENNNKNTIIKLNNDYLRYLSQDFRSQKLNAINEIDLKEYTQKLTKEQNLKKKAFYAYKGILNLIFEYATYHKILDETPVKAIKNSIYLKNCDTSKSKNVEKILSEDEIRIIIKEVDKRIIADKYKGYCVYAFVVKLAIETGMRVAELCSLKKSDVTEEYIHIHSQQLYERQKGGKKYIYADYTKDEKGISNGGRYFPITPKIKSILEANEKCQTDLGLTPEYVFCNYDGDWIKSDAYETFLRRMMKSLNMPVTNNHAFRMSLNSNVFIPLGINVADRAALLGHSIETNLKHYSFARKDNLSEIRDILSGNNTVVTPSHPNVIPFDSKKESHESTEFKAFI